MSINQTAYDTTACSYTTTRLEDEIRKAALTSGLHSVQVQLEQFIDPFSIYLVEGGNSSADAIQFFRHPYLLKNSETGKENTLVLDVRSFGKYSTPHAEFAIRNGIEYVWHLKRAILNQIWLDGRVEVLRDISNLPMMVYAALISQTVSRRFALDPAEQMSVAVLSAYFYMCLFTDEEEFSSHEMPLIVRKIADVTKVPVDNVTRTLNGISCLHGLPALCDAIKTRVGNVALDNFNIGTLLSVTTNTWWGTNAQDVLGVGLEHVPTWLLIVEASLSSATFKRSTLSKIAMQYNKGDIGRNLSRSIESLIGGRQAVRSNGKVLEEYGLFF